MAKSECVHAIERRSYREAEQHYRSALALFETSPNRLSAMRGNLNCKKH
jgi:hypothetical protein